MLAPQVNDDSDHLIFTVYSVTFATQKIIPQPALINLNFILII